MTLKDLLLRRISVAGPISLAEYMAECLMHPELGYYTTRDPLGGGGDFITAPEISQMFGELVGLALAQTWLDIGAPPHVTLAELGPGRGTLMADVLRVAQSVPGFSEAVRPHLVERSPALRAAQAERVADAVWHDAVSDLPEGPLLLVANEFFDALPIRQFTRDGTGWCETMVTTSGAALSFARAPSARFAALDHRLEDTRPGDIVELCPALSASVAEIAERVAQGGGLALVIDYGGWRSRGDTFQAMQAHTFVDPLEAPGTADLTAHVDFEVIASAARAVGAEAWGPVGQGAWLGALGIAHRAARLAEGMAEGPALEEHLAAFRRLTEADQMGTLFQAMALTPPSARPPPGFQHPAAVAVGASVSPNRSSLRDAP
ncbi:MAG: SAM-dependent methyltransferase [Acidobacteriota bacterium]